MLRIPVAAALAVLVACSTPPPEPPRDTTPPALSEAAPSPSAEAADPFAPLTAKFAASSCDGCPRCDVDVASLAGHVTVAPAPAEALLVRVDAATCGLSVGVRGGLARDTDYVITLGPGFRDVWGNTSAEKREIPLHTAKTATGDTPPPVFLGSWPPDGDLRLAAKAPVTLWYDRPVRAESVVISGASAIEAKADDARAALVLKPKDAWPEGPLTLTISGVTSATRTPAEAATLHLTRPAGTDAKAPTFRGSGVPSAATAAGTTIVHWDAAQDDVSPASAIRYFVYAAGAGKSPDLSVPTLVTEPGVTTVELAVDVPPLKVAVRAQDEAGNVDSNELVQVQP